MNCAASAVLGPVSAAGILLFRVDPDTGERVFLLQRKAGKRPEDPLSHYEDLGGKVEPGDATPFDTACRETEEETNGLIPAESLRDRVYKSFYNERSKYVIFLMEANPMESDLTTEQFGSIETHTGYGRVIQWVPCTLFKPTDLGYRLRYPLLLRHMRPPTNLPNHTAASPFRYPSLSWRRPPVLDNKEHT